MIGMHKMYIGNGLEDNYLMYNNYNFFYQHSIYQPHLTKWFRTPVKYLKAFAGSVPPLIQNVRVTI